MFRLARPWRALPLAAFAALALTPSALAACPTAGCGGGDPEPEVTPPSAVLSGPDAAVRTDTAIVLDARGSDGGADAAGVGAPITRVDWDLDGATGWDATGPSLTHSHTFPRAFALGDLTVRVKVTSKTGSSIAAHVVDVRNRLPVSTVAAGDTTAVVGQVVTFTGTATDADSDRSATSGTRAPASATRSARTPAAPRRRSRAASPRRGRTPSCTARTTATPATTTRR